MQKDIDINNENEDFSTEINNEKFGEYADETDDSDSVFEVANEDEEEEEENGEGTEPVKQDNKDGEGTEPTEVETLNGEGTEPIKQDNKDSEGTEQTEVEIPKSEGTEPIKQDNKISEGTEPTEVKKELPTPPKINNYIGEINKINFKKILKYFDFKQVETLSSNDQFLILNQSKKENIEGDLIEEYVIYLDTTNQDICCYSINLNKTVSILELIYIIKNQHSVDEMINIFESLMAYNEFYDLSINKTSTIEEIKNKIRVAPRLFIHNEDTYSRFETFENLLKDNAFKNAIVSDFLNIENEMYEHLAFPMFENQTMKNIKYLSRTKRLITKNIYNNAIWNSNFHQDNKHIIIAANPLSILDISSFKFNPQFLYLLLHNLPGSSAIEKVYQLAKIKNLNIEFSLLNIEDNLLPFAFYKELITNPKIEKPSKIPFAYFDFELIFNNHDEVNDNSCTHIDLKFINPTDIIRSTKFFSLLIDSIRILQNGTKSIIGFSEINTIIQNYDFEIIKTDHLNISRLKIPNNKYYIETIARIMFGYSDIETDFIINK